MHAFGAVFGEARVDADLGRVRIPRVVGAYAVGRRLNEKTAHSQLMGGIVWGVSMALFEESLLDTPQWPLRQREPGRVPRAGERGRGQHRRAARR